MRLVVFQQLERIVNPCGALWRAKSTHSSGSLSRKSITLTIGKCAMRRQMLKCCKWLCGSNNCVELSVSDEYSTECLFCKFCKITFPKKLLTARE